MRTPAEIARTIDLELRQMTIRRIRKRDLKARYNIDHNKASSVWSVLTTLGWSESWSYLERQMD